VVERPRALAGSQGWAMVTVNSVDKKPIETSYLLRET
jgi:hypothetical protein